MNSELYFCQNHYNVESNESEYKKVNNNPSKFNGSPFVSSISNNKNIIGHSLLSNNLNETFFSKQNIDLIQNEIIQRIYKKTNNQARIGRQSDTELEIVMRSIYLQYSKNLPNNIKKQIYQLNEKVLDYCVNAVYSELQQYIGYLKDIDSLKQPLNRPKNMSSRGTISLERKVLF
jgi:hypothetical protein